MKNRLFSLIITAGFATCAISESPSASAATPRNADRAATASNASEVHTTDRLIVKLRDPKSANVKLPNATVNALSAGAGVGLRHLRAMSGDAHVMALPGKMTYPEARALAQKLMKNPQVEYAEPDRMIQALSVSPSGGPNDPKFIDQWSLKSPADSAGGGTNVRGAWDITTGSAGMTIAVIDTGLLPHADIAGNILNGSGRVVPGYDFIGDVAIANDGDGRDADPTDVGEQAGSGCGESDWHGTHVAGIIGALSNNGVGMTGINWVSKILPLRVLGKCGKGWESDMADAVHWAVGGEIQGVKNPNPARVLNLSLHTPESGPCSNTVQNAVNAAVAANAVVVAAAGNDSRMDVAQISPANCNGVISVAATGPYGSRTGYTSVGEKVKIAAPGGDTDNYPGSGGIVSTYNAGTTTPGADSYRSTQGTSQAAPHVSGVVSLMLAVNPALTPDQVLSKIQDTARAFPSQIVIGPMGPVQPCVTSLCGAGIIDARAAIVASDPAYPGNIQFAAPSVRVDEWAGSVTVSVRRLGGAVGPASVSYFTANGTATIAGGDYTGRTGSLNWADGDSSTKTISIPIADDGVVEQLETFTVNLGSPNGASLGLNSSIVVNIIERDLFPQNGEFPVGWTKPTGAFAGWSVANDSASEGQFSLKADPTYRQGNVTAQVEVTKVFAAGLVSFSRRVYSDLDYDYLRFYIDGVQQAQWDGDVPWQTFSYSVPAGAHTFRWSYEKGDCCSTLKYAEGAWIDAVSLPPVATTPGSPTINSISPGPGRLTINFTAPASNGGVAIAGYTASCSAGTQAPISATGSSSPIIVTGLLPAVSYVCTVAASNAVGTGTSSAQASGTAEYRQLQPGAVSDLFDSVDPEE